MCFNNNKKQQLRYTYDQAQVDHEETTNLKKCRKLNNQINRNSGGLDCIRSIVYKTMDRLVNFSDQNYNQHIIYTGSRLFFMM